MSIQSEDKSLMALFKKFDGIPSAVIGAVVLAAVAYGAFYTYRNIQAERAALLLELETEREVNYGLLLKVREKEGIIGTFQGQIDEIFGTVGILEKLAATDEELLKKYSKVYFLNENYTPAKLVDIEEQYLNNGSSNYQIHADVWPQLERLLKAAQGDGVELLIASAFRSFDTQSTLKSAYKVTYGSGANQFSADQGYSEHQLGTAVDFTTPASGTALLQTADPAYKWLLENAYNYGFILSYPPDNDYYKFEPWHWRYVGRELASRLHDEGKHFYDLDQRVIDTYLIKLFD